MSVFNLFPPEEFCVEVIWLPDGGAEYQFHITGRTRAFLERQAAAAGLDLIDYVVARIMESVQE